MMLGGIVIWYRPSVPLRNSAPQPYFSTRTTPRVLPTLKPSAARPSMAFGEKRSSTSHMMNSEYDVARRRVKALANGFGEGRSESLEDSVYTAYLACGI